MSDSVLGFTEGKNLVRHLKLTDINIY